MKKIRAFTLIELLVVISIIAILAGLAFKAFGPAIEKGRATTDMNNLKGIGQGIRMYLNQTEDSMFSATDTEAWPVALQKKFVPDWHAFQSPFDKRPTWSGAQPAPISYALSKSVLDTNLLRWDNPASTVIVAASNVNTAIGGKTVKFVPVTSADGPSKPIIATPPSGTDLGTHQARKSIHVLFGDGHVDQMDWIKYIDSTSEIGKQRWNPMSSN